MESPVGPPGKQVIGQVIMSLQSIPFVFLPAVTAVLMARNPVEKLNCSAPANLL